MALSANAVREMLSQSTGEVYLVLLTITHAALAQPFRVVNNNADVVSGGNTFLAFPFAITLPHSKSDEIPRARLTISNVTRDLVALLRSVNEPPVLLLQVIRASNPDTVEISYPELQLLNITGDTAQIQCELGQEDLLNEPFPYQTFRPDAFPALFN